MVFKKQTFDEVKAELICVLNIDKSIFVVIM